MSSNLTQSGTHADPYKEANEDNQVSLSTKVGDLITFIESCKFCMMATHAENTNHIVSRCMALAGKVKHTTSLLRNERMNANDIYH